MTDYECRQQQFTGWDNDKRIAFIHDLTAICLNTIRCGIATSVTMNDWLDVMPASFERPAFIAKKGAYQFLFQMCIESLIKHANLQPSDRIACVFDENNFVRGAIAEHYVELKRDLKLENRLGSLTFGNKLSFLPLQAADMVAYEGYKHAKNQIVDRGTQRVVRKLWDRLMASDHVFHYHLFKDGLQNYVNDNLRKAAAS